MANFGAKTPVSILNEFALKKGCLPRFDLIMNGCGRTMPKFAYAVQLESYVALGEGRSKQEAKHQAARKLLEKLNISYEDEYERDVKLVVPYEDSIGYNAVGALVDYCGKNCYPEPIYDLISEVGPPHEKMFTIKCSVSKLSTSGEARTKKDAKHKAAHKMLMQLQQEAGDEPMAVALPKKSKVDFPDQEPPRVTPVYIPQVQLYKDFCNAYLRLMERSETLTKILKDWNSVSVQNSCKSVLDISRELDVAIFLLKIDEYNYCELPITNLEIDYSECSEIIEAENESVFITMQLHPPVVSFGKNIPVAAFNLLGYLKEFTN